jgi:hypothetical protein
MNQISSVGIATDYKLVGWGQIPGKEKGSLLHSIQTSYDTNLSSYQTDIAALSPGIKQSGQ